MCLNVHHRPDALSAKAFLFGILPVLESWQYWGRQKMRRDRELWHATQVPEYCIMHACVNTLNNNRCCVPLALPHEMATFLCNWKIKTTYFVLFLTFPHLSCHDKAFLCPLWLRRSASPHGWSVLDVVLYWMKATELSCSQGASLLTQQWRCRGCIRSFSSCADHLLDCKSKTVFVGCMESKKATLHQWRKIFAGNSCGGNNLKHNSKCRKKYVF